MKGVKCERKCLPNDLVVKEYEFDLKQTIDDDEVIVETISVSLNYPDVLQLEDKYQFKPQRPFAVGGEFSAKVIRIGKNVKNLQINDHVLKVGGWGASVQYHRINESELIKIPKSFDPVVASSILFTYGTCMYSLIQRGNLKKGEVLLVSGASGGIGQATIVLAKKMGAIVIAAASSDEKLKDCKRIGADYTINYTGKTSKELKKEIFAISSNGIDVCMDVVGGDILAQAWIRSMAWNGRYLVVGFVKSIPSLPLNLALLKNCDIRGVFWGAWTAKFPEENQENIKLLFDWIESKQINIPAVQRFSLEDIANPLNQMKEGKLIGKACIVFHNSKL